MGWLITNYIGDDQKIRRMMVNTDVTFAYREDAAGLAVAVSIVGIAVPTGEPYNDLLKALEQMNGD